MTPSARKLMLTIHLTTSVGWAGALAVFLAHAIVSLASHDDQIVRAASIAMGLTAWFVIVPLSFASFVSGIVQALGTAWGLVRHYWVLFKLVLTVVATGVLLLKLEPINQLAEQTALAAANANLVGLRTSLALHAAGGLLILLAATVLGIYKPAGLTPYGMRREGRADTEAGTPRWVKVTAAVVVVVVLLLVVMMLVGNHALHAHDLSSM